MRLAVFSDSHGNRDAIRRAFVQMGAVQAAVHLGDGCDDWEYLAVPPGVATYHVRGNNDYGVNAPWQLLRTLGGWPVFMTHGHRQNVKFGLQTLVYTAQEQGARLCCFGHTHAALLDESGPVILLNPGALGDYRAPSFALVDLDDRGIRAQIVPLV
jgi:putative phosphoesterase